MILKNFWKTIFFIILVVSLDQLIGLFLTKLYNTQRTGRDYSMTYLFERSNDDIMIFGSSRALHHYDPRIIADSLSMTCYNFGVDGGQSLLLAEAQLKVILNRYSPKMVVVDIKAMNCFEYRPIDYVKLSVLRPYFKSFPELHQYIDLIDPLEKYKLISAIYPYNSMVIDLLRFNTDFDIKRQWMFDGYIPIREKVMSEADIPNIMSELIDKKIDSLKIQALENIVFNCKKRKVKLILINSPIFTTKLDAHKYCSTNSAVLLKRIVKKDNLMFFDFSADSSFVERCDLFADVNHLNEKGASLFSKMIIPYLKK